MDNAGYFSFGTANDFTFTAARHCRKLIVEVNENMSRVFGDSPRHVSEVDAIAHPKFRDELFKEAERLYLV
jgi:itaconate CoA-transferase